MENESPELAFIKIKITHLIKFSNSFAGVEIHLLINNKFVKMNYANEQFIDILRKLQQKDMEEVYILPTDCKKILDEIQVNLSSKTFYDPKTSNEQRMQTSENSAEVVKTLINQLGVDKVTVEILKSVNKRTHALIEESPSIFAFVKKFKDSCSEEYLKSVLTGYVTSLVIDKFPWKSTPVKEKAALASMLCDITLAKNDFTVLREYEKNGGELAEHIKNHPRDVAQLLSQKKEIIPSETITIIEQHHELPDGTGFPGKIDLSRFNQLSSIFICSQKFIEHLFDEKFDYTKRLEILQKMKVIYHGRTFDKAMSALITVVD